MTKLCRGLKVQLHHSIFVLLVIPHKSHAAGLSLPNPLLFVFLTYSIALRAGKQVSRLIPLHKLA